MPTCAYDSLRAIASLDQSQSPEQTARCRGSRDTTWNQTSFAPVESIFKLSESFPIAYNIMIWSVQHAVDQVDLG